MHTEHFLQYYHRCVGTYSSDEPKFFLEFFFSTDMYNGSRTLLDIQKR